MKKDKVNKADILDRLLLKFEGNKTFTWPDIDKDTWWPTVHSNKDVVVNHINFLVAYKMFEKYIDNEERFRLTPLGYFTMTNIKTEGYVYKSVIDRNKKTWKIILGIISVATFVLVSIRFYRDFISPKHEIELTPPPIDTLTKLQSSIPIQNTKIDSCQTKKDTNKKEIQKDSI